ncbi:hypothetical protein VP01_1400g3 [Puccinia sorghi]|uniref:Uncharacterized protein n=1 Tax=Puccinia sorghi TaxID=27349 RepID=A0A0L6VKY6_9BASI|nr:hypothetical protein VP01_1400g3 [Puccinia sorghi]
MIHPTIKSPALGRMIRVRLGPVICDLPAIRKLLGLAGHSLKYHLCQFCHVNKDTLDIVDIDRSPPLSDKCVRYHCLQWKKARKVSKREQIFKQHGVRYSVLLKLPYFNLLDDAVVEPLHKFFLGLLNNHGTEFFGLKKNESTVDYDSEESDRLERKDTMIGVECNGDEDTISISSEENDGSPSPDPATGPPLDNADINLEIMRCFEAFEDLSLNDPTMQMTRLNNIRKQTFATHKPNAICNSDVYGFTPVDDLLFAISENLQLLRAFIDEIQLPLNIGRVPRTVGQPKGGKLKAEEWINLFSILLIPTFFLMMKSDSSNNHEDLNSQLFNLLSLVSISNIVRQNWVRSEDIQNLQAHLKTYRQGILHLYPQFSTKPNHHLALHLPECISRCGAYIGKGVAAGLSSFCR